MVRSWLRGVRWSATTSALVAIVALFGATAVASSLVAVRQPAPPSSSADARLASLTSDRPADTVATTTVERRAPRATTTTTIAAAQVVVDTAPPAPSPFVGVDAGPEAVAFGTTTDPAAACEDIARWRVTRAHPEANVVVSEDGQRLEERDPTAGEVLDVLATWDAAAGAPAGEGVAPDDPSPPCEPPVEQPVAPAETTVPAAAEG